MSVKKSLTNNTDPAVFGRASLKLTFEILRKKNPQLALQVRNIASGRPLPKLESELDNKDTDNFMVELDSFQVRTIVEILMEYGKGQNPNPNSIGMEVVAKTLTDDWIALARKMFSELPDADQPAN